MRLFLASFLSAAFLFLTAAPSEARHRHHLTTHKFGRYLSWRHLHPHRHHIAHRRHRDLLHVGRRLPGPCYRAAAMGGPCGCWAAYTLLGRLDHVWHGINLWLANDWLQFPRAQPAPGTAAVWPHRHVAPVIAVHNDKTGRAVAITTHESWGDRRVKLAGLVIVQPPTTMSRQRRPIVSFGSGVPL